MAKKQIYRAYHEGSDTFVFGEKIDFCTLKVDVPNPEPGWHGLKDLKVWPNTMVRATKLYDRLYCANQICEGDLIFFKRVQYAWFGVVVWTGKKFAMQVGENKFVSIAAAQLGEVLANLKFENHEAAPDWYDPKREVFNG